MPYQKIRATWISLPALLLAACGASLSPEPGVSGNADVVAVPMLRATAEGGFRVSPLFTVGEGIGGYRPPGVLDGMAAFARDVATIRVYVNHELAAGAGYPYGLANGTVLTGARMSWLARFGAESGMEASIWRLDPRDPSRPVRIAVIDRGAVPHGMTDPKAAVAGEWESSGIIDLSALLDSRPGEVVLLATVQAHGVRDGAIGGRGDLVEAGQLLLLSRSP